MEQADIIYNLAYLSIFGRVILQPKIRNAAGELNVGAKIMDNLKTIWKSFALVWAVLTAAILLVDYVGVRVIDFNGLVFKVHIYWYCLSLIVAAVMFSTAFYYATSRRLSLGACVISLAVAGAWWLFALFLIMGFHGTIGGWY